MTEFERLVRRARMKRAAWLSKAFAGAANTFQKRMDAFFRAGHARPAAAG